MVTVRTRGATLTALLTAWGVGAAAQSPRPTELLLDSVPADSVKCGGLTFQFARFFREHKHVERHAIDSWVWNRTDSMQSYDPKMLAAVTPDGRQLTFLSPDEVRDLVVSNHGFLGAAAGSSREAITESSRSEYASGRILPHASAGRRILMPDNDKDLDHGVTLYCGTTKLGLLHKEGN